MWGVGGDSGDMWGAYYPPRHNEMPRIGEAVKRLGGNRKVSE